MWLLRWDWDFNFENMENLKKEQLSYVATSCSCKKIWLVPDSIILLGWRWFVPKWRLNPHIFVVIHFFSTVYTLFNIILPDNIGYFSKLLEDIVFTGCGCCCCRPCCCCCCRPCCCCRCCRFASGFHFSPKGEFSDAALAVELAAVLAAGRLRKLSNFDHLTFPID